MIANDGKADRMIMATKLLNQRIKDVMCARKAAGQADITPTLVDLERTHILFVNAHFKPFAAIGYEYNKVRPQSGNPALGNAITFSIPQFGDFFHDMVGRQLLSSCSSSLQTAPTASQAGFPASAKDWDNSTTLTGATYSLVDPFGNPVTAGAASAWRNMVRYCEYPGERLYRSVKFDVNGNPLDEYNDVTINMLRKFTIGKDKMVGYQRLVGQETVRTGYGGPKLCAAADSQNNAAVPFTTLKGAGLDMTTPQTSVNPISSSSATFIAASFPDTAWQMTASTLVHTLDATAANNQTGSSVGFQQIVREVHQCTDGPQTPKYVQPALEIWNKLRFWFNDEARLSIPSVSIPFGQRFITIDLAPQADLVTEFPGLYVRQVFDRSTSGTAALLNTRTITYKPWISAGTISTIALSRVELYVNNIFVNPEIHDIFIKRIGFSLIRVYRQHRVRSNSDASDDRLLSQLKWPIEVMFVGLRPTWNINSANTAIWRDWHRMTKVNDIVDDRQQVAEMNTTVTGATGTLGAVPGHVSRVGQINPISWSKELKTVNSITLTAHGINIHDNFSDMFFNAYNPFHYGGPAVVTPDDEGALMINFSLFPGSYQPSGHLNVSRAREFFLNWTTSYVTANTPADLLAVAIAINFLLITDGSAVLRYST